MPKVIEAMCDLVSQDGVLIQRSYLQDNVRAVNLLSEAKRRALQLIDEAQKQAEEIRQQVRSDAYAAGMLQSLEEIVAYLDQHTQFAKKLRNQMSEKVRNLLQTCTNNPNVVLAIFDEYLATDTYQEWERLDVLLPESYRCRQKSIIDHLGKKFFGKINIEYHPLPRFVLRMGEHVAEFAPDHFIENCSAKFMSELPSIFSGSAKLAAISRENLKKIFIMPDDINDDDNGMPKENDLEQ